MKITKNKFNPYLNQFNTIEGWSEVLKTPIDCWKNKKILMPAPFSALESLKLLIDLGKGKKLYDFQHTDEGLLAFPSDEIGSPIKIENQIYQFHIDTFLKRLAIENGFDNSGEKLSKEDYVIGKLTIGSKKIIWVCSFQTEGFKNYKIKPYFEDLDKDYNFILLSDCFNGSPHIEHEKCSYIPLSFDLKNFRIDFHNFIKRECGITSDEARGYLKDKVTFFIDNKLGKIFYKNKLTKIRKGSDEGTQSYRLFIELLKKPSMDHSVEDIVNQFLDKKRQDLYDRGRGLKNKIKKALQAVSNQKKEIDGILPDIKKGVIRLNISKDQIFFF